MDLKQWLFAKKMISEAYKSMKITNLPASIVASQAILETGWGRYIPVDIGTGKFSFNLFGIKGIGTNGSVKIYTHEFVNGEKIRIMADFRAYYNYKESFIDYGKLILYNNRYRGAVKNRNNARKYIEELVKAGYATDPLYARKVIQIAEQCKFLRRES